MLGLFLMPCTDNCQSDKENHEHSSKNHEHKQQQNEENPCSPLCSCACCGIRVIQPENFVLTELLIFKSEQKLTVYYKTPLFSKYFSTIWHPPQEA